MNSNEFKNRVEDLKATRLSVAAYAEHDLILTRFQKSWQPLIDHMQHLVNMLAADRILPQSARLKVMTELKDKKLYLHLILQKGRCAENTGDDYAFLDNPDNDPLRWEELTRLSYYTGPGAYEEFGVSALLMSRCSLRDLFRKNANNIHALIHLSGDDSCMKKSVLHPDRMDAATTAVENWLVRQVAFAFEDPSAQMHQTVISPAPKPKK